MFLFVPYLSTHVPVSERGGGWDRSACVMRIHLYSIRQYVLVHRSFHYRCCSIALYRGSSTKAARPPLPGNLMPGVYSIFLILRSRKKLRLRCIHARTRNNVLLPNTDDQHSVPIRNPVVSVVQYSQGREAKREQARGTWHLSSTCWETWLCKGPLCQVRHHCGNSKRRREVGVAREQFFYSHSCCFFLLERQLFQALVFLYFCVFSSGWVGLKVGQKCCQIQEGWVFCSPLFHHVEIKTQYEAWIFFYSTTFAGPESTFLLGGWMSPHVR